MRRVMLLILAFVFLSITGCSNRAAGTAKIAPTPENTISGAAGTASPEPTPLVLFPSPTIPSVSATPSATNSPTDTSENMENQWSSSDAGAALAAFKAVLENQSEFYSIENKKYVHFDDFLTNEEIFGTVFEPVEFTVLDMDGDQVPEVVIALQPADMSEVLHYTKGEVEGSIYSHRELGHLKADGTFSWAGSASHWGFGKLNFDSAHDYRTNNTGYMDVEENNGEITPIYH